MNTAKAGHDNPIRSVAATVAAILAVSTWAGTAQGQSTSSYVIDTVAEGLDHPWAITFMPGDDRALVTERRGRLALIDRDSGDITHIDGVPEVVAAGQGGLLDVEPHPDFESDPWIYLTYSGANEAGETTTYVGRGRLDLEAGALTDFEEIFVATPYVDSNGHYGSRMVFDADNYLYVTVGDRQNKNFGPQHPSQDLDTHLGKTLRLQDDGSIPPDNPFVDDDAAQDAIYTYGHRNVQGMAIHPETGEIWQNEHGERNGDEINILEAGGNFGWPIATFGRDYSTGAEIGDLPQENPDTVDPVHHWGPDGSGFPPSGFIFYDGDAFPEWQGDAFMGNLAGQYLGRFEVDGREIEEVERLLDGEGWRIRDMAVGPDDGAVYVLIDDADVPLIRLIPEGG